MCQWNKLNEDTMGLVTKVSLRRRRRRRRTYGTIRLSRCAAGNNTEHNVPISEALRRWIQKHHVAQLETQLPMLSRSSVTFRIRWVWIFRSMTFHELDGQKRKVCAHFKLKVSFDPFLRSLCFIFKNLILAWSCFEDATQCFFSMFALELKRVPELKFALKLKKYGNIELLRVYCGKTDSKLKSIFLIKESDLFWESRTDSPRKMRQITTSSFILLSFLLAQVGLCFPAKTLYFWIQE